MSLPPLPSNILINGHLPDPIRRRYPEHIEENYQKLCELRGEPSEEDLERFVAENPDFPLETQDFGGRTIVGFAINAGSISLINSFLNRDPTIATNAWGYKISSYVTSAAFTNLKMVQAFMQRGADINAVSETGLTPLFISSRSAEPEAQKITKFLLLNGAVLYQFPREEVLCGDNTFNGSKEQIAAQPQNILNAIAEIKREHLNAHKPLTDLTKEKKLSPSLTGLPDVLAAHIMRFLPEAHLRYQFMVNNGHINGATTKEEDIPEEAPALIDPPQSAALSLDEADWNFDLSHEALIDCIIASNVEGADEEESKESTFAGSSSIPASSVAASSPGDLD